MMTLIFNKYGKYFIAFGMVFQYCYSQATIPPTVDEFPCLQVPDSLQISYHNRTRISYLYKKSEKGENLLVRARVYSYYDLNKRKEVDVFDRVDLLKVEYKKHPNSYLNSAWLEASFYRYVSSYPEIIKKREEFLTYRYKTDRATLYYFSFGVYTCSRKE